MARLLARQDSNSSDSGDDNGRDDGNCEHCVKKNRIQRKIDESIDMLQQLLNINQGNVQTIELIDKVWDRLEALEMLIQH